MMVVDGGWAMTPGVASQAMAYRTISSRSRLHPNLMHTPANDRGMIVG